MRSLFFIGCILMLVMGCAGSKKRDSNPGGENFKADKTEALAKPVDVKAADLQLTDQMQAAMETYIFTEDKKDFVSMCKNLHFDCTLNGKRFPKDRRKVARKIPPFMSGSKNGVVGDQRVLLKFNFYPGH